MSSKQEGSKIRILSIAYAQGRLTKDSYRRLRTSQLSALDFNKPSPELPPDLSDIEIPKINIDLPRSSGKQRPRLSIITVAFGILALIVAVAIYLYTR